MLCSSKLLYLPRVLSAQHRLRHTIYALSSGFGKCGVAVIRISGPGAKDAITQMCNRLPNPRSADLKKIRDPQTKDVLDHGLVLWFPGPSSFTGEDSCEFQVHGGPAVLNSIFTALSKLHNFRPAEKGEFARRAFLGGKLDLTSAEGLADLINAETECQRKQAVLQMDGVLCQMYSSWRAKLSKCLANIEAYIDFEEDENLESSVLSDSKLDIRAVQKSIKTHLADGRKGERIRSGVSMTIVGAPNVGKSSLLNALSQQPTAIVCDLPGTTRDVVKIDLDINGFPVNVRDTAGLRSCTNDIIEIEGMSRARAASLNSDINIIVADARVIANEKNVEHQLHAYIENLDITSKVDQNEVRSESIVVLNKIDLVDDKTTILSLKEKLGDRLSLISCKSGEGIDDFIGCLTKNLRNLCGDPNVDNPSFTQPRHRFCLEETEKALTQFFSYSDSEIDLAGQEIRNALYSLGKITGHVSTEDILDIIFKDFCIGK